MAITSLLATQDQPSSMPSADRSEQGERDIGAYADPIRNDVPVATAGQSLHRDLSRELDNIYEVIGSKQVPATQLTFAPPFVLQEALETEHESNWTDAYDEVPERDVPRHANVITSHVVYKIKTDEENNRKMKARIVPHGNRDDEKDRVRKDSSNAPLFIVRLLLSLVTFLGFRIGTADIKGAFLQSGPIQRDIYVRPPREWSGKRGIRWKLRKLPYGIVDAGRQWQKTVESWMLMEAGVERVFGLSQLFAKRSVQGNIELLIVKVTDEFLLGDRRRAMHDFVEHLQKRFEVGKIIIDDKIHFDGCEIEQDSAGNIKMSMSRYLERLNPIELSRARRKQRTDRATEREIKQYRWLAATLMFLGSAVLPQASYATSLLQQMIPKIRVQELIMTSDMLKELLTLKARVVFKVPAPVSDIAEVVVSSFSDASFNHSDATGYGQTGLITGLRIKRKDQMDIFHPIDWCRAKQKRVRYRPYGAEVLAYAEADNRAFYLKSGIMSLFPSTQMRSELSTDSRCLYDTITTLHEARDYRLRPTVQRIRNSFDPHKLNYMRWIAGDINPSDALTKRNAKTWAVLNEILATGLLCVNLESGYGVDSEQWQ